MEAVMVFFIGSVIGSFLNVMVIRSEQGRDFVFSFSQCPACGERIRFYDLMLIASWLLLRGRCRHCHWRISLRYPLVELIGGLSALWCWRYGEVMNQYVSFAYLMILLCIALSDQDCQEIPVCYLIYIVILYLLFQRNARLTGHVMGMVVISLPLALIILISKKMGWGDCLLSGVCGLFLGWEKVIPGFLMGLGFACLQALFLLAVRGKNRKTVIPFAPALCLGYGLALFYGDRLFYWYYLLIYR